MFCHADLCRLINRFGGVLNCAECLIEVVQLVWVHEVDQLCNGNSVFQIKHFVSLNELLAVMLELPAPGKELLVRDNDLSGWQLLLLFFDRLLWMLVLMTI